jgi:hypothetical protein
VARDFHQQGIESENAGGLVVPEVTIELLAIEKTLADDTIRCLVATDGVAEVRECSEENDEKRC